jgi:hypothetical protein
MECGVSAISLRNDCLQDSTLWQKTSYIVKALKKKLAKTKVPSQVIREPLNIWI